MNHSPRQHARAAGVLYLVTHVTSVLAVVAYGSGAVPGGVTLEFALATGCAGTGVLLWLLLREQGPARAAMFAALRGVEAAVIVAGAVPLLATTIEGGEGALPAAVASPLHAASFLVGQGLVIGANTIVLGWLLWDSRAVPRPLAALGAIGGAIVLASDLAQVWRIIPLNGAIAGVAAIPIFAFELWFAIALIAVGLRPNRTPMEPRSPQAVPEPAAP